MIALGIGIMCLVVLFFFIMNFKPKSIQNVKSLRSAGKYSFWQTSTSTEYITFLNELDIDDNRKIVSVSNSSYAFRYLGPYNIYTVIYEECEKSEKENIHYEYSIFETASKDTFTDFLNTLSDEFEIFNISIGSYALDYLGPYHTFIVTYRKAL